MIPDDLKAYLATRRNLTPDNLAALGWANDQQAGSKSKSEQAGAKGKSVSFASAPAEPSSGAAVSEAAPAPAEASSGAAVSAAAPAPAEPSSGAAVYAAAPAPAEASTKKTAAPAAQAGGSSTAAGAACRRTKESTKAQARAPAAAGGETAKEKTAKEKKRKQQQTKATADKRQRTKHYAVRAPIRGPMTGNRGRSGGRSTQRGRGGGRGMTAARMWRPQAKQYSKASSLAPLISGLSAAWRYADLNGEWSWTNEEHTAGTGNACLSDIVRSFRFKAKGYDKAHGLLGKKQADAFEPQDIERWQRKVPYESHR